MVVHYSGMSLGQALHQTLINHEHSTMSSSNSRVLEENKHLVGALDSACKRTCAGPQWLDRYLLKLKSAPSEISGLITSVDESENFRFGNGGVVPSGKRWRLPCSIGGCIVLVWVSLVPVTSLGCLLGRDFLDAVGAVLNFGQRTLDCTFLGTGTQRLQQMAAGHFMLQMIPEQWTRPAPGRWRKCGQDGIVELQLTSKEWLNRVLREGHNIAGADSHDHMLTESSLMAGRAVLELHDAFESTSDNGGPLAQEMRFSRSCSEVRQQRVLAGSFQNEQFSEVNGCRVEQHRAYEIGPGTTSPKDADGRCWIEGFGIGPDCNSGCCNDPICGSCHILIRRSLHRRNGSFRRKPWLRPSHCLKLITSSWRRTRRSISQLAIWQNLEHFAIVWAWQMHSWRTRC